MRMSSTRGVFSCSVTERYPPREESERMEGGGFVDIEKYMVAK